MTAFTVDDLHLFLDRTGAREYLKLSVPMRHGRYHEVQSPHYRVQFSLNAEVKYLQGRHRDWPHPAEWLKRTPGDDWIYYSVGSYNDVFDLTGEYYFPCLSYDQSPFFTHDPFTMPAVKQALNDLDPLLERLGTLSRRPLPEPVRSFFYRAARMDASKRKHRAGQLHRILGESITILPPDTRHVDYAVIPAVIARGCLYHCGFCRFKTRHPFTPLNRDAVLEQMAQMKAFLGQDLPNYNAVFFGQHDALMSGKNLLTFAAEKAYEIFELERSHMKDAYLFFFGSVDAMLGAGESLFDVLNRLPYRTFINIGLESMDAPTLAHLKKPVAAPRIREAFLRMLDVNRRYPRIEVTANFVLGKDLPPGHLPSILDGVQNALDRFHSKGTLYFSPLHRRESKAKVLVPFNALKAALRLPAYVYLPQRL